jgi:hypothetical protein
MTTPPCLSSWPAANSRNRAAYRGNSRAEIHSALNEFSLPFAPTFTWLPHHTSITALVICCPDTGFAARALIDALPIFGLGFSSSACLCRRDSSPVLF